MKKIRYIKFYTPENEIAEGIIINKLIFNDEKTDIDFKLLTSDFNKKWFTCKDASLDIIEDKAINLKTSLEKMINRSLNGIDKLEYLQV